MLLFCLHAQAAAQALSKVCDDLEKGQVNGTNYKMTHQQVLDETVSRLLLCHVYEFPSEVGITDLRFRDPYLR